VSLQRRKRIARDFLAALERRDRAALEALLVQEARWVIPRSAPDPYAGVHQGRGRILDLMLGAAEHAFVPGTHRIEELRMAAEGDVVFAEVRMTAKTPRGPDYENFYVFVFEFEADRIRELHEHVDTRHAATFFS
jgi:ketosteroid isomerase-like protein